MTKSLINYKPASEFMRISRHKDKAAVVCITKMQAFYTRVLSIAFPYPHGSCSMYRKDASLSHPCPIYLLHFLIRIAAVVVCIAKMQAFYIRVLSFAFPSPYGRCSMYRKDASLLHPCLICCIFLSAWQL